MQCVKRELLEDNTLTHTHTDAHTTQSWAATSVFLSYSESSERGWNNVWWRRPQVNRTISQSKLISPTADKRWWRQQQPQSDDYLQSVAKWWCFSYELPAPPSLWLLHRVFLSSERLLLPTPIIIAASSHGGRVYDKLAVEVSHWDVVFASWECFRVPAQQTSISEDQWLYEMESVLILSAT